jgi:hypothetical protein
MPAPLLMWVNMSSRLAWFGGWRSIARPLGAWTV